ELAALEPDGRVHWTLARPNVKWPVWAGNATDTRIAYLDATGLRVVAGDGTGDHLISRQADGRFAWRPHTSGFVLGYLYGTQLRIKNVETQRVAVRNNVGNLDETELTWSPNGRYALAADRLQVTLVDVQRGTPRIIKPLDNDYI